LRCGDTMDALAERLPSEQRRQQRLELDMTLRVVRRMRGASAGADADGLRLEAEVAEGARRRVVAVAHAAEIHVAAGERAAAADRPAIRDAAIGAAGARADVRVSAARLRRAIVVRALTGRLSPPSDLGDVFRLTGLQLVAHQVAHGLGVLHGRLENARLQLTADLLDRVAER